MEIINITVKCDKTPNALIMEDISMNLISLFSRAGSAVNKVEFNYDNMKDTSATNEINDVYAAIRKEERKLWKQYVKARETFGDDDSTTRRFVNGWSAIYDLMRHLEMI